MFYLLYTLILLFAMTQSAAAEPITLAIFGSVWVAANATLASIISFAFSTLFSIGVSLLQKALTKKNKQPEPGVNFEIQIGDDNPIAFPFGRFATAGTRKFQKTYGTSGDTPNAYLVDVIQYSDLPNAGLLGLWVNGEKITFGDNDPDGKGFPVLEYRKDGVDHLWVRIANGTQIGTDEYLFEKFGTDPDTPWTETMIGRGCAYLVVTSLWNRELFSKGFPQLLIEPDYTLVYDPRKDDTNGGSGDQRWSDPDTYEGSDNPAVLIYNIIKGMHYVDNEDNVEWLYGGQSVSGYRLPLSNWVAAMNECDVLIDLDGGGQEKQYRAGYEVLGSTEPLTVIEELLKACNGRLAEVGGQFKILIGAPATAVYSFTDDDIIVTQEQGYRPYPSLDETYNAIEATYPEPAEMWNSKSAPLRVVDGAIEIDGRYLPINVDFIACPFGTQTQRLQRTVIEDNRRFAIHTIILGPEAWALEPLDIVSWTSVRNGYDEKKFMILQIEGEMGMNQVVTIKEIDPSDYDWSTDYELPTNVTPVEPTRPPSQPMSGWTVQPAYFADDDGNQRIPSIQVSYASGQVDVRAVRVQVRLASSEAIVFDGEIPYSAPYSVILNANFLPNTEYEVRGIFIPFSARPTEWSAWLSVTTYDIPVISGSDDIGPNIINYSHISQEFKGVYDAVAEYSGSVTDLRSYIDQLASQSTSNQVELRSKIDYVYQKTDYGLAVAARQMTAISTDVLSQATILDTVYAELYGPGGTGGGLADGFEVLDAKVEKIEAEVQLTIVSRPTTTSLRFAAGASTVNDAYKDALLKVIAGPLAGYTAKITAYNGSTLTATLDTVMTATPTFGDPVVIGMTSVLKATSTSLTSLTTTVNGNTSNITQILQSVDGTYTKYAIVGTVNGVTGGFLWTGIAQIDGSVSRTFAISADNIQFGDFNNYLRNPYFDSQKAAVNPVAAFDISGWNITQGVNQLDILTSDTSGVPANAPGPYVLKANRSAQFTMWNVIDPAAGASDQGVYVRKGDIFRINIKAAKGSGAVGDNTPYFGLTVKNSSGTNVPQDIRYSDGTTGGNLIFFVSTDTDWHEYSQDYLIDTDGHLFLQVINLTAQATTWYFGEINLFRRNGVKFIVDGTIDTNLVNGQAITTNEYIEIGTGADDIVGTGSTAVVWQEDFTFTLPPGYDAWLICDVIFGMDYAAASGFNSYVGLQLVDPGTGLEETGISYGANFNQAVSIARNAIPVTGPLQGSMTYRGKFHWQGLDSDVTLVGRSMQFYIYKR